MAARFGFGGAASAGFVAALASRLRRRASARSAAVGVASAVAAAAFLVTRFGLAARGRGDAVGLDRRRPSAIAAGVGRRGLGGRLGLGDRDVAADVDPPAGQPRGEPGVLALAADGQREHPLGHGHARDPVLLVDVDRDDLGRAQRVGHEHGRVVVPRDDVDLLAGQLGDDGLDARAALADGRADRVEALLARRDGDLRAAAGLAGDGLDLDGARCGSRGPRARTGACRKPLWVRLTKICGPLRGAPDLEHERLDVLADAVVLEGALLGRGEDRLDVLADVEDDRRAARPG